MKAGLWGEGGRVPGAEDRVNVRRDYLFKASGSKVTGPLVASANTFQDLLIEEQVVFRLDLGNLRGVQFPVVAGDDGGGIAGSGA